MRRRQWHFDDLLAPHGSALFEANYWQQQALHIARNNPDFFTSLVSTDDVDFLIATHGGKPDFAISVIGSRCGTGVPPELRSSNRLHWTPDNVYQRLAQGATIRIGNIARYMPAIGLLVKTFESQLQTDITINLYYTPSGSRAFEAHYDNHDVFILQVAGCKRWKLYQQAEQAPVEVVHRGRLEWLRQALPEPGSGLPTAVAGESQDIILKAGDLLYVPRGRVHQVSTLDDSPSLHLTVAAPVVTWYEVCVHALMGVLDKSPELRAALPVTFATDPDAISPDDCQRISRAVATHITSDSLKTAIENMGRQFIFSRRGHWHNAISNSDAINGLHLQSRLQRQSALLYRLEREPGRVLLIFWGQVLPIPIRCDDMLQHILQADTFSPAELPTRLDDESRLVFCHSLLEKGFITLADKGGAT